MGHLNINLEEYKKSLTTEYLNDLFKTPYENKYPIKDPVDGIIHKYVLEMADGQFAYFNFADISGTHFPIGHTSNFAEATSFYEEELPELNYYINDLNKFIKQDWEVDNDTEYQWHSDKGEGWKQEDYFVPKKIRKIKLELQ